jgi:hypothetical protein
MGGLLQEEQAKQSLRSAIGGSTMSTPVGKTFARLEPDMLSPLSVEAQNSGGRKSEKRSKTLEMLPVGLPALAKVCMNQLCDSSSLCSEIKEYVC